MHQISRSSFNEQEFRDTLLPILPILTELLSQTGSDELKARGEKLSTSVYAIIEQFRNFLHPIDDFEKISTLFEELNQPVIMMIESLEKFAKWKHQSTEVKEENDMIVDTSAQAR